MMPFFFNLSFLCIVLVYQVHSTQREYWVSGGKEITVLKCRAVINFYHHYG